MSFFSCLTGKLATNDLPLDDKDHSEDGPASTAAIFQNPNVIDENAELETPIAANAQELTAPLPPVIQDNKK